MKFNLIKSSLIFVSVLIGIGIAKNVFANSLRSKIEITQNQEKLEFKVIPNEGLVINPDGPWSLSLRNADKSEKKWDKKSFNLTTASISVPKDKEKFTEFTLVAFVCTQDKKKCYRDLHKQSL